MLYSRILCGEVVVNGECLRDPKVPVSEDSSIEFAEKRYVSRGGDKLEYALEQTGFQVKDKVILDAGSSTGGFTDCLLQHGARHVHAVDVGTNQLAYSLRIDARVSVLEKTNIMTVTELQPAPDVAVADISFRSLRSTASKILDLTFEKRALALAKPQFEWPKHDKKFDGVLRNTADIRRALLELCKKLTLENVQVHAVVPSPIAGRKGNREFFLLISRPDASKPDGFPWMVETALRESERFS